MAEFLGEKAVQVQEAYPFQVKNPVLTNVRVLARTRDMNNARGIHILRPGLLLAEATSGGSFTGYMQFYHKSSMTADVTAGATTVTVVDATGFNGGDKITIADATNSLTATITSSGVNETTNVITFESSAGGTVTAASTGYVLVVAGSDSTKVAILAEEIDISDGEISRAKPTTSDSEISSYQYNQPSVSVIVQGAALRSSEIYGSGNLTKSSAQRLHFIK